MNNNKKIIISSVIIAVSVAGVMWRSGSRGDGVQAPSSPDQAAEPARNQNFAGNGATLAVRHRFINGTHTYSGTITTPTPCYRVHAEANILESYPEQIVLSVTVQEPDPDVICIQMIAEQPFSVNVRASQDAAVRGELNGAPTRLEVIEGGVEFDAPPLGIELVP